MNTAQQIKAFYTTITESGEQVDVSALMDECQEKAKDVDQDWDAESTTYEFVDGSVIVVCNSEVSVYGCKE
ncbi:hypothetical protein KLER11_gp52 [Pararheinheimera phage vB_PsoM_KLER1-1]|nr:hypothetical protein KLER11_gp52 [Pararheinheimera phage vB_PsoM_KLER1-1]